MHSFIFPLLYQHLPIMFSEKCMYIHCPVMMYDNGWCIKLLSYLSSDEYTYKGININNDIPPVTSLIKNRAVDNMVKRVLLVKLARQWP